MLDVVWQKKLQDLGNFVKEVHEISEKENYQKSVEPCPPQDNPHVLTLLSHDK